MKISNLLMLESALETLKTQKVSFNLAYKISLIVKDWEFNMDFYRNQLKKMLLEYAEKDNNGNFVENDGNIKIKPEFLEIFKQKYDELLNSEVVFEHHFTMEDLEPFSFSVEEVQLLLPLIE